MSESSELLERLAEISKQELDSIYYQLETLCLYYPGRVTGSQSLAKSIDYLYEDALKVIPSDSCRKEEVHEITRWVRYGNFGNYCYEVNNTAPTVQDLKERVEEKCFIHIRPPAGHPPSAPAPYPATRQVRILANGLSVGTGPEGVSGEVVVISSWDELQKKGDEGLLQGKIVLYDYITYTRYGELASFRFYGADRASKYGAIAVLIRTLTPNDSLSGAHTGVQDGQASIPSVCIAIEECELIRRLISRGYSIDSTLIVPCAILPPTSSYNLLFEIKGTEKPEEIILIGGHIDSWDCQYGCCQGAHDDGQAVVICTEIVKLLHKYNLHPKRTIRAVAFTDEEVTQTGAIQYQERHQSEAGKVLVAIETDCGIGPVCGYNYQTNADTVSQIQAVLHPLSAVFERVSSTPLSEKEKAGIQYQQSYVGVDITPMVNKDGVPGLLLKHADDWVRETYFHYHHSPSDSIDHIDKQRLYENFFFLLGTAWLLANSERDIRQ